MNVKWRKEWQRFLFTRIEVCKRIAPGLKKQERDAAHKVTSEFMRIKDMLFYRKDSAGELTEEEAMAIIYVPTKYELLANISSELTLETAAT